MNMIIGFGNTGTNIVKEASKSFLLKDEKFYAIDSVATDVDSNNITIIPIISDDKDGSGRDRERGAAMYSYHEELGDFVEMYMEAKEASSPVILVTSAAGGTGSGSIVPAAKTLVEMGVQVIPIIVCPNDNDPDAYHLNTGDLFIELGKLNIETYSTFENTKNLKDYDKINKEIVKFIELILGKHYKKTTLDSIDDSDLDKLISIPGRIVGTVVEGDTPEELSSKLISNVYFGYQQTWKNNGTFMMTACSLESPLADKDFEKVFHDINEKIGHIFDRYKNIVNADTKELKASIIIVGLPSHEIKTIEANFELAGGIGSDIKKVERPSFMKRHATTEAANTSNGSGKKKFIWSK